MKLPQRRSLFMIAALLCIPAGMIFLAPTARRNAVALIALHAVQSSRSDRLDAARRSLAAQPGEDCSAAWMLGMVEAASGRIAERDAAWGTAIGCSAAFTELARLQAPDSRLLAEAAVNAQPDRAEGWFWLAELSTNTAPQAAVEHYWRGLALQPDESTAWLQLGLLLASLDETTALQTYARLAQDPAARSDPRRQAELAFILGKIVWKTQPAEAIRLYREALALKPLDAVRWYELGDLLTGAARAAVGSPAVDLQAAIDAYLQSCYLGDPGKHGCFGAGQAAELLGDLPAAIRYYRLSDWDVARQRADQLERGLP